jgi:hypothetical protein
VKPSRRLGCCRHRGEVAVRPGPKSVSERAVTGGDAGIAARASHGEGHVALFGWCASTSGGKLRSWSTTDVGPTARYGM